jgi:branched-subunit amino acid ABC-type transport system permease component
VGVNVDLIYTSTFAIGSRLAAAAGALLGPVNVVFPQMGDLAAVKAFAIVILGGLGNITGAVIGGFILALAEELGAGYVRRDTAMGKRRARLDPGNWASHSRLLTGVIAAQQPLDEVFE